MSSSTSDEAPTEIDRRDPLIGSVLDGRFRLDARIAAGGMGAIYRATQEVSGRKVAIKVLHPDLATDPRLVARFRREGAVLSKLRDPHTVTTYEVGADRDGTLFIAMELLRGESLFERLRRGPVDWQTAVSIARQVCDSLLEAHAMGLVHRDLKPANIHLEPSHDAPALAKVLDFGIAKPTRGSPSDDGAELTTRGQLIGTFEYMAPEQLTGQPCDERVDLYSLGVVMYEMLVGRRPFAEATSAPALLTAALTRPVPPPSTSAAIPARLDRIILTCLAPTPELRCASVVALARALDDCTSAPVDEDEAVTRVASPRAASAPVVTELIARQPERARRASTPPVFDMEQSKARDARIRRMIWLLVALTAAGLIYGFAHVLHAP